MNVITYSKCPLCQSPKISLHLSLNDYSISKENFDLYKCKDCSFLFTQNIPSEDVIAPYYKSEEYISHSNTKKGIVNSLYHIGRNYMLKQKLKLIQSLSTDKDLLDIGSGTGYFPNFMQKNGYKVLGVEADPDARSFAQKEFGIEVISPNSYLSGEKSKQQFGVISLWHVLEHLHQKDLYLETISKNLKEDGLLIIAVPNHDCHDSQVYKKYWAAYDVPRHLWHFTPKTMELFVQQHGFKVISKKRMVLDPFYVSMLSHKYKNQSSGMIMGGIVGMWSYLKSLGNVDKSSSVIYILKKLN